MGKDWNSLFFTKRFHLCWLLIVLFFPCLTCVSENLQRILVISFDGFRYNYPNASITPTLIKLALEGTRAEYINNVFETKTFPNHHSIATGLYPDFHGVITNPLYDPLYKRVLNYSEEMWHYDDNIIPIWIHNEESNNGRYSGVYMWPGSNFKYHNRYPTFSKNYTHKNISWTERVDTVISWFTHPATPANFVMMYFDQPDGQSHKYGPNSPQVHEELRRVDNITNYLQNKLIQNNLTNSVNVFLLSDHGMASVPPENLIEVTELIKSHGNECLIAGVSPVLHVIPPKHLEDNLYFVLKNLSEHSQFSVYRKNELPPEWLYKNNRRIPPIMLVANEGYAFDDIRQNGTIMYGVHGYDNKLKNMHPFFIAYGPRIKKNYTISPFQTVDLFSLFCHILDLQMMQTNGTFSNVQDMLLSIEGKELEEPVWPVTNAILAGGIVFVLTLLCLIIVLTKNVYNYCLTRSYEASNGFSVSKEFENIHLLDSDEME